MEASFKLAEFRQRVQEEQQRQFRRHSAHPGSRPRGKEPNVKEAGLDPSVPPLPLLPTESAGKGLDRPTATSAAGWSAPSRPKAAFPRSSWKSTFSPSSTVLHLSIWSIRYLTS